MRFLEREGHVLDNRAGLADRKAPHSLDARGQVFPLEKLQHEEGIVVRGHKPMVEDADDVRTLDLRGDPRFADEAPLCGRLLGRLRGQDLHHHLDAQRAVVGDPEVCHSALCERTHQTNVLVDLQPFVQVHGGSNQQRMCRRQRTPLIPGWRFTRSRR